MRTPGSSKLALLLVFPVLLTALTARAGETRHAVVMPFTGPDAAKVRTLVVRTLVDARGIELAPSGDAERFLKREGMRVTRAGDRAALARELELSAVLIGRVRKFRGYEASVAVYDDDGRQLGVVTWRNRTLKGLGRSLPSKVKSDLLRVMGEAQAFESEPEYPVMDLEKGPSEPVAGSGSSIDRGGDMDIEVSKPASVRAERDRSARGQAERPLLRVEAGPSVLSRSFSYADKLPVGERAFRYDLPGAPVMAIAVETYPLPNVGLRGAFGTAVGLGTTSQDGSRYEGSAISWSIGAQAHAQIGPAQLGGRLQGGRQTFSMGIQENRGADGPDVAYTFIEPAFTARYAILPSLEVTGAAGFRFVRDGGELTSNVYLSRVHIGGVNAEAAVAWRMTPEWELQLSGGIQRYFASAAPLEGAALIRGASVDIFRQVGLGVAWRID